MGWEWEVEVYVPMHGGGYRWATYYQGDSRREARRLMRAAKREGYGAIRVTWRPT